MHRYTCNHHGVCISVVAEFVHYKCLCVLRRYLSRRLANHSEFGNFYIHYMAEIINSTP
ncbi:hypothetical protein AB6D08_22355 [Vibrio splendidus]